MDLWIEFYFALSEKWAVGVMGCQFTPQAILYGFFLKNYFDSES
jgi:hypothetical protein